MQKSSFIKIICLTLSLALLLVSPLSTSFSVKLNSTQKTYEPAKPNALDLHENNQSVLSYKKVKAIPDSSALDLLESRENTFLFDDKAENARGVSEQKNKAAKNEENKGNPIDSVKSFLELYKAGINDLEVYLVDIGGGLQEFYADYNDNQGNEHTFVSGIYYDEAKGLIYGKDNNGFCTGL